MKLFSSRIFPSLLIVALLIGAILFSFAWQTARYDVCVFWRPGLTPQEKLIIALNISNKNKPSIVIEQLAGVGEPKIVPAKYVPFSSAREVLEADPECCSMYTATYQNNPSKEIKFDEYKIFPEFDRVYFTGNPNKELHPKIEGVAVLRHVADFEDRDGRRASFSTFSYADFNQCKRSNLGVFGQITSRLSWL
ncbi:MAG: hypothetical protein AB3N23_01835 [Paracoccaceae bacterium]